ncbi:MAG TPA: STAS domain-containing protein [Vicinamibacteria bacterium]|nr:STAS domain-containing protein [Vicinamibacteria bacterium]
MRIAVERQDDVLVVRVLEAKLTYPVLSSFFASVRRIVDDGGRQLVIDLEAVAFIDSPSIGCLLDIHRLLEDRDGTVKLAGLQPRVQTLLFISGLQRVLGIQRSTSDALALLGVPQALNSQPGRRHADVAARS